MKAELTRLLNHKALLLIPNLSHRLCQNLLQVSVTSQLPCLIFDKLPIGDVESRTKAMAGSILRCVEV